VAGPAQQPLHPPRPVFLLDLDQRLQFAQVVGVAQRVQHALQRVVRMPVVVHDNARNVRQQAAAFCRDPVEGEQHGRGDVQPLRLTADAEASLIHVLDRRGCHLVAHDVDEALEAFGAILTDPSDGRRGQPHAEQIGHQRRQTFFGQQLVVQQVEHERADPPAILHRCGHPIGKARPRLCPTRHAPAVMRPMFGNHQRLRFGQVKHLPRGMAGGHRLSQRRTTPCTGRRIVVDDCIGRRGSTQRLPRMALLPTRLLARGLPQAADPHRLLQPIARWRFAAVAAVQPEPALQLGKACLH
jgi:hypothetical protein